MSEFKNFHDFFLNVSVLPGPEGMATISLFEDLELIDLDQPFRAINERLDVRLEMKHLQCSNINLGWFDWFGVTVKTATFTDCSKNGGRKWEAVELENVKFSGKIRGEIIIRTFDRVDRDPEGKWLARTAKFYQGVECSVDLTDAVFSQYSEFQGIPAETVRRGPGQFVVDFERLKSFGRSQYPNTTPGRHLSVMSDYHGAGYRDTPAGKFLNRTGVFVVPLLARDAKQQLEDCKELVDLGLLLP